MNTITTTVRRMVNWLLEPLSYAFMQRGFLAAIIVGVVCALVGCYIVLRGMAFFGDALAHAILPGLAAGYLVQGAAGTGLFWWALGAAVLSSLGIGALSRAANLKQDTAIGIIFAGMFALGIAMISTIQNYALDLAHFLFGNVLGVSAADLRLNAALAALVLLLIILLYKEFLVLSFDPLLARTLRLPARALEAVLLVLIAVAIVVSLQTVGVALVVAMLVTPAATASLVSKRLPRMMVLAAAIAAFSGVAGLYISFYWNVASGAAIVLVCTAIFGLVWSVQTLSRARTKANYSAAAAKAD
jgi:manganese/iron transport system permease protein